jgi:hypothetical protein
MTTETPNSAPSSDHTARVETDLPCAKCGYNLRTLAWDGKCPECSAPVLQSAPPVGFRFASQRSESRARRGIGLLALAFLIDMLGTAAMTLAMRLTFVAPPIVHWVALYMWVYAGLPASIAMLLAIVLTTQPFASRSDRFKLRLAYAATALALVGTLGVAVDLALRFPTGSVGSRPLSLIAVFDLARLCWSLALLLLIIHLLLRIHRAEERMLWLTTCTALAAALLLLSVDIVGALRFYLEPPYSFPERPDRAFWDHYWTFITWWYKNVAPAGRIAILLSLLLLLHRLRRSPRQKPRARRIAV